jgi:copper chaperone CopZ
MRLHAVNVALCLAVTMSLAGCGEKKPVSTSASDAPLARDAAGDAAPIEGTSATLHVVGLSCPLCAHNIDKQLVRVPGVTGADVNLGDGTVSLTLVDDPAARPSRARLKKAVDDAGFQMQSIDVP